MLNRKVFPRSSFANGPRGRLDNILSNEAFYTFDIARVNPADAMSSLSTRSLFGFGDRRMRSAKRDCEESVCNADTASNKLSLSSLSRSRLKENTTCILELSNLPKSTPRQENKKPDKLLRTKLMEVMQTEHTQIMLLSYLLQKNE